MSTENTGGHDVPLGPPPAAPSPPVVASADPTGPVRGAGAGRPIGIVLAAIGGVALAVSGTTAAFAAAGQLSQNDSRTSLGVDGIRGLVLDVDASDVTVEFADVVQAELAVQGGRSGSWSLEREGEELVVNSPNRGFGWWFGGWFGDEERVVLTLPQSLQGIDADIDLNAGSLDVTGTFGEVDVIVGAGALSLEGSAESVDAEINAGRADLDLFAVREADLTISAGRLTAEFANSAPDLVTFEVSAGSLELTLPDEVYDVRQEVSAGSLDNGLQTSSDSRHVIEATVSAGSATLRAGD
ncbi:DUF4097 family beta strand repeat-containing protein [Microbacterium tumbae]